MRDLSEPTPACEAFLAHLQDETTTRAQTLKNLSPSSPGAPPSSVAELRTAWENTQPQILETSHFIHSHPEVGYREFQAVSHLKEVLQAHDLPVETGVFGVDTAMYSSYLAEEPNCTEGTSSTPQVTSADSPTRPTTVAFLSEYDALPEIGHGCGHNVICAGGLGAYLTMVAAHRANPHLFHGKLEWYGTPAEEGFGGKAEMIKAGAFQPGSIDAALMVHGFDRDITDMTWLGRREAFVTFKGIVSHASSAPFMGRNALDAASLAYQAIGLLRQAMPPSDRVHAVIVEGGDKPSMIPEKTRIELYIRSKYPQTLADLSKRIDDIMQGAALMTGCGVEVEWDPTPATMPQRQNMTLAAAWVRSQQELGRSPLAPGVIPDVLAASTDFGNVSYLVPGIQPLIGVGPGNLHTREFCDSAGGTGGDLAAVDAAWGLARVALDVFSDPQIAEDAAAEDAAAGGPVSVADFFQ